MTKTHADNPLLGPLSRADFISENMSLVYSIAHRFKTRSFAANIPTDDVISEGAIGLILAYDRYADASKSFATFAAPYIRGYIRNMFRDKGELVTAPRDLNDAIGRIKSADLIDAKDNEVAERLGLSVELVREAKHCDMVRRMAPLDPPSVTKDGDAPEEPGKPDDHTAAEVREFLSALNPRQREVTELLMSGYTRAEIARRLGVSRTIITRVMTQVQARYLSLIPGGKLGDLATA